MTDKTKKSKWLKKLKRLLKAPESVDPEELQAVLDKLRAKAEDLSTSLAQAEPADDTQREEEKLELLKKHIRKGEQQLEDLKADND